MDLKRIVKLNLALPFICSLFPILFLLSQFSSAQQQYQIILDGEDPIFSVKSGTWTLDKSGSYYGNFKFSAPGPGTGSSIAVWTIDGIPYGTYSVEFYVDNGNYAQSAEYIVESASEDTTIIGYVISTVIRSQNYVGTGWHYLGTFNFRFSGRITQTDHWTGAGTKVIADALRLTYLGTPQIPTVNVVEPAITIVIDDLGAENPANPATYTYQLFSVATEFTYSVLPFQPYTIAVLQSAQAKGLETILHQPMQYIGQPDYNPSDSTRLYVGMTDSEILTVLRRNLDHELPYIVGLSNHQGSRFSQFAHGLQLVMDELKIRNLFFYDSRTISDSVAYDIAKKTGLLTAERDLFIDGATQQETKNLVNSLALRARYAPNYNHLAIGHPRANTVPALIQVLYDLETAGIKLRRLSRAVGYIIEADTTGSSQPIGSQVEFIGTWYPTSADMISQECEDGVAYYCFGLNSAGYCAIRFKPNLPKEGYYQVFVGFSEQTNSADSVRVTIHSEVVNSDYYFILNQSFEPNRWHYIGTYPFSTSTSNYIQLDNSLVTDREKKVIADCVKFVYDSPILTEVVDWQLYK